MKALKERARPEDVANGERAMRALVAFANSRYDEAYELASSNGTDRGQVSSLFRRRRRRGPRSTLERRDHHASKPPCGMRRSSACRARPPAAHIELARAYAAAGRAADARKSYEEAFRIWKDADADLPLLLEARAEYQRLGS